MKNTLKFYFVTLFFLAADFVAFAQGGPGDEGDGEGGVEGGDPQPAPINSKLILLAIIGILFVVYTYRKNKRTV